LTTYISQGSAATDLIGDDSFNSSFLHRSFLNLTVTNYGNWSTICTWALPQCSATAALPRCLWLNEYCITGYFNITSLALTVHCDTAPQAAPCHWQMFSLAWQARQTVGYHTGKAIYRDGHPCRISTQNRRWFDRVIDKI